MITNTLYDEFEVISPKMDCRHLLFTRIHRQEAFWWSDLTVDGTNSNLLFKNAGDILRAEVIPEFSIQYLDWSAPNFWGSMTILNSIPNKSAGRVESATTEHWNGPEGRLPYHRDIKPKFLHVSKFYVSFENVSLHLTDTLIHLSVWRQEPIKLPGKGIGSAYQM